MSTAGQDVDPSSYPRSGSVSPTSLTAPTPTFDRDEPADNGDIHEHILHTATTSMSSQSLHSPTSGSSAAPIENFNWKDLEARFASQMGEFENDEARIYEDFGEWSRLFQAWASTTTNHENERALKRLRTRMRFVQGSEARLEEKREHHQKVVEAFESALKLMEAHS